MDRGMLMAASAPHASGGFSPAFAGDASLSDAEIMLRAKAGDQSAFEYLVQKYRRPMLSFMYRMARNAAAAEDLAQEVFLRVYRSRESYEASAKFTTWLYRIATNLAVNHARDTRHERPEVQVSLDEPDEDTGTTLELPDASLNAEQAMVIRERMMAIRAAAVSGDHAQVSADGLQADRRGAEEERVGYEIVALPCLRDFAGTVERVYLATLISWQD
jgi:RNA polymerase sigma factor (sigma-70 family)